MRFMLKRCFSTYPRALIHRLNSPQEDVSLLCWVHGVRKHKDVVFADLSDGLSARTLQAIFDPNLVRELKFPLTTGCSIRVKGDLVKSQGRGQTLELIVKLCEVFGACDAARYPFRPKKDYDVKFERNYQHFRVRLAKYAAIHRIRSSLIHAFHHYFKNIDFCHVQTPIITSNDCEGGGETFLVHHPDDKVFREAGAFNAADNGSRFSEQNVKKRRPETFFPSQCHLTVSSQLHLEAFVHSISRVYTIQPTFRAENALSSKHLCEFAMLEAELVAENLSEVVSVAEGLIKAAWTSIRSSEDLNTVTSDEWRVSVDNALADDFVKITYDEALRETQDVKLECPLEWGDDLTAELEKLLIEKVSQGKPLVVTHFPAKIKPFYMKRQQRPGNSGCSTVKTDDSEVADCFDILMPVGGEIVGGSLREVDPHLLDATIRKSGVQGLDWYLELRKFGSMPHGGFGLGIDRLLQFFTRVNNIKDVVAFPRWYRHCQA